MLQGGSEIINSLLLNFISLNFVSFVTTTSVKLVVMHHRRHLQPDVLLLTLLMHQRHHLQEPNVLLMHHRRHLQPGVLLFVWLPRTILVSCLAYLVLLKLSKNPQLPLLHPNFIRFFLNNRSAQFKKRTKCVFMQLLVNSVVVTP
jgi:ABC-type uncharacterized transport system permease subunit